MKMLFYIYIYIAIMIMFYPTPETLSWYMVCWLINTNSNSPSRHFLYTGLSKVYSGFKLTLLYSGNVCCLIKKIYNLIMSAKLN